MPAPKKKRAVKTPKKRAVTARRPARTAKTRKTRTVKIEHSANSTEYRLMSDHGTVDVHIDSDTCEDADFAPTKRQVMRALACLLPKGTQFEIVDIPDPMGDDYD